ncbi:MAG TPA: hypothetical protein VK348_00475 [Planctomycetota bacterium]|nr:hypothetical protein [Planctomycetota bacterium]
MELGIYAHPWDLRALAAHGGLARLRDLGFTEVALAVSYHAGRWLTPWHPDGMVRFLEDGTVHFRPRGDYGLLQPKVSREVPADGPSPLEWLCSEAPKVGLKARAWTVCTHNSRLGELHPECCVENAFGDRYTYALCPALPAAQQYVLAMLADLGAHSGLHAIELEAFGWMGWKHSSHHEKASFVPDAFAELLLSLCWCAACTADLSDAAIVRQSLATALRDLFAAADAMVPSSHATRGPGAAQFEQLQGLLDSPMRLGVDFLKMVDPRLRLEAMLRAARRRVPPTVKLAVQVHQNERFRGSQLPASPRYGIELGDGGEYVATCYGDGPDGIAKALTAMPRPAGGKGSLRLCIHPRAPQFTSDDDLRKVRELCAQHGVTAISIYHLGLLPWRTIERVAAVLR